MTANHIHRVLPHLAVGLAIALTCVTLALEYGLDVPWDYYNYHAYAAHLLSHDRLGQDFFPAGLQGYLNPIGFAPFALAQSLPLNSMGIAAFLAVLHSLNAFFLYLIARELGRGTSIGTRWAMALGWLLGASAPVFLIHLGSTFVDPIGSALVLGAVWLTVFHPKPRSFFISGLLAAAATSVKLSNAIFMVGLAFTMLWPLVESRKQWFTRVSLGAAGMIVGLVATQGYWSVRLYETMGNPFFPLFNSIFQSPYYPPIDFSSTRFRPESWGELFSLPIRLMQPNSWVYMETVAPAFAPALCCVALVIVFVRKLLVRAPAGASSGYASSAYSRLALFVALVTTLWIVTSTNGRYAISLFMLLGPFAAATLMRAMPPRYAMLFLIVATGLQIHSGSLHGVDRWGSKKWTPRWLAPSVPASLTRSPQLFISIELQSHSELVPLLHPDSVYVNLIGSHYSIPSEGPSYLRLKSLIDSHYDRTQIIIMVPQLEGFTPDVPAIVGYKSALLDRVGLRISHAQCKPILLDVQKPLDTRFNRHIGESHQGLLLSCKAEHIAPQPEVAALRVRAVEVMNAFEEKCPELFYPPQPQVEGAGMGWVRKYTKYDNLSLYVNLGENIIMNGLSGQTNPNYLGKATDWRQVVADFQCSLPGDNLRGSFHFNRQVKPK